MSVIEKLKSHLPEYSLDPEIKDWLEKFILKEAPESLKEITDYIESTIQDGVIDVKDIPAIIKCISQIIQKRSEIWGLMDLKHIFVFIKYVMDCLIDSGIIVNNYFEKKTLKFIVDTSLELLEYNFVPIDPAKNVPPINASTENTQNDARQKFPVDVESIYSGPETKHENGFADVENEEEMEETTCCGSCLSFKF